jgi:hypothetical protein
MGQEVSKTISCTSGQCVVTIPASDVVVMYMYNCNIVPCDYQSVNTKMKSSKEETQLMFDRLRVWVSDEPSRD